MQTQPLTLRALEARAGVLERVERRLRGFLDGERARWCRVDGGAGAAFDALCDLIFAGGKRVRPAFCASGFLAAGGDPDDPRVVDVATGLELLHASALIHDDVMDDSELRRGRPTVHVRFRAEHGERRWSGEARRYGEAVAIVVGDLALVYADRFLVGAPAAALELWADLRAELIVGQYLDVAAAAELRADPTLARWIAVSKSGRYTIHGPLLLGALLAGRRDLEGPFEAYGTPLGEAFQLRDDLIGAFGDGQVAGKPVGLDLHQRKMTLLLALAVGRDQRVRRLVTDRRWDPADAATLAALLTENGTRAEVERRIDSLVEEACRAIAGAPLDATWRSELAGMANLVAYRER